MPLWTCLAMFSRSTTTLSSCILQIFVGPVSEGSNILKLPRGCWEFQGLGVAPEHGSHLRDGEEKAGETKPCVQVLRTGTC